MLDSSKHSIINGDHLKCDEENLIKAFANGTVPVTGNETFVVRSSFGREFVARINDINIEGESMTFTFLNPDKAPYPDQSLRTHEIKSIFQVQTLSMSTNPITWGLSANKKGGCNE